MQKLRFKSIIISVIVLNVGVFLRPGFTLAVEDSLLLARQLYRKNDYVNAQRQYQQYLSQQLYTVNFADYVIEASLSVIDPAEQRRFILKYVEQAPNFRNRKILYEYLGFLSEYMGDYPKAIAYYTHAYMSSRPLDYELYLRIAMLNFELGEYPHALYMARTVMNQVGDQLKNDVLLVMIRSMLMMPNALENMNTLALQERIYIEQFAQPNLLYLLYLGFLRYQQIDRSQEFLSKLLKCYPDSPESLEMQGKIRRAVMPSLLWW
ncbi:tetratricopeptide repeat protein [Entomospira entomophila]|uniref:Tetratricopeptide repeat protein n=1 Tax=Entomospira entomophila TaxID=2719988 RepID=A0A968KR18_9SPIO|nr:tetratricopeptide repeat protein [Entomospira entomophilus]NIZ40288.1 tetratricopeptide repeat protein [Entomospira entomophilus]WDI35847.1 tetratricopeptide repeat protein [Entomospira entomophilus]